MAVTPTNVISTTTMPTGSGISVCYHDITRISVDGRDAVQLLKPIQPDYILRAYWKWGGMSEEKHQLYKLMIARIKSEIPGVNVGGYFPLQYLLNATNQANIPDTWANGSLISVRDFDSMLLHGRGGKLFSQYAGYIPDLRSKLFQDYVVGWVKREKEAGIDSIHFDGAGVVESSLKAGVNIDDLAAAFVTIVDRTRSETGLMVTALNPRVGSTPYSPFYGYSIYPHLDFTDAILWKEDLNKPFSFHENYTKVKEDMIALYGNEIPLNVLLDYASGASNTPLAKFAALSVRDKKTFLRMADADIQAHGASFIYPVMGGFLVSGTWDSVASGVYNTIVELARNGQ